MRIHVRSGPARKKPRVGDRRTSKKHGEQIRVFSMARDMRGNIIGYDCTGGRQRYEWVPIADAAKHAAAHHWTAEERVKYGSREAA
ncbi:hypothetical protein WK60_13925 [Burkholderia ubonensis]|uniref:hypothetical protein n=1 Tax=Burkholderia ubonensis TaxID=101571 RepID=UPI000754C971|nr:hypothetical protein [Burkholderia ubonensis]KVT92684.1 hypothetical protein WK60_13925 [Burkholderia ubonensis]